MKKIHKILLGLVAVLVVGAGLAVILVAHHFDGVFKNALPNYAGQEKITGLSADVHIYRDAYGVPHIFASNMNDAARALGYIHASERMFQMEMQRRAGQGRLSEIIGSDMLGVDKFIRTLGLYHLAESSSAAMSREAQDYFQAYADGVNAWMETHQDKLSPEFAILGFKPEPWKVADSVVWGKLMALQLSNNYKKEMLRAHLTSHVTPQQMGLLFPTQGSADPVTVNPHQTNKRSEASPDDVEHKLAQITGLDHAASNEWVIAGAHTETGKPILANDPHLGLEAPILWYLARIVTPEVSVKGGSVPGLPIVLLGQNDHIAWGFTTTGSDVQDLFVETIDPEHADHYLTPKNINGGSAAFATRDEVIHVKHGMDVTLHVRTTRHGPVMSDINPEMAELTGKGKVMALAFAGLGDKDLTSESLMHINRATNGAEFVKDLMIYQAPPQNAVYADDKGMFGFINPGLVPVRKKGDGLMPVDGASGTYDWIGNVPFTQLPQVQNPKAGFVFNANNQVPFKDGLYYYGQDWEEPYRAERLQEFFNGIAKHSLGTSAAMQADHISLAARKLLPYLLAAKPSDKRGVEALDRLRNWDGAMDKDKPEPLIFEAWMYQMRQLMLVKKADDDLTERGPYMATSIEAVLGGHFYDWCGKSPDQPVPDCNGLIATALDKALDMAEKLEGTSAIADWRWGHQHFAALDHKLYSHVPFLKARSDLKIASSGDFYTLDRGGSFEHDKAHPFNRTHGGGYRGIYDLGNPDKSLFMIASGESGHINSPHYADLLPLWNDVKAITLSGSEKDLAAQGLPELVLEKAP